MRGWVSTWVHRGGYNVGYLTGTSSSVARYRKGDTPYSGLSSSSSSLSFLSSSSSLDSFGYPLIGWLGGCKGGWVGGSLGACEGCIRGVWVGVGE